MPLRSFSFLNTSPAQPEGKNWRVFDEASKTVIRSDLVVTNGTATPVVDAGYFTLYGPIVFYDIKITLNNNDGWTTSSYIDVPFPQLLINGVYPAAHLGHAFIGATGAALANTVIGSTSFPTRLAFSANYTNTSGADQVVYLQGWYYRG